MRIKVPSMKLISPMTSLDFAELMMGIVFVLIDDWYQGQIAP